MNMKALCTRLFPLLFASGSFAGQLAISTDQQSGVQVYSIEEGDLKVQFAPSAGGNVFSIRKRGVEYFRQPPSLKKLPGVGFGNPVLYPTPNRVRDAKFTFDGETVAFKPNAGSNFIHGLVNRAAFEVDSSNTSKTGTSVRCKLSFSEGSSLGSKFPFPHTLYLTVFVADSRVRWTYDVDNTSGSKSVPFGFALHPYFTYLGKRENTFLTIPATHLMESVDRLPTGKLIAASELNHPLHAPMSLQGTQFDDVFFGMTPKKPATIEFRDVSRKVTIRASKEFTHLVVWTPNASAQQTPRNYFGIESQTCSTDAHNLHAKGKTTEAHLQICPPGQTMSGWVEYEFE